jgi:hypothetical protein
VADTTHGRYGRQTVVLLAAVGVLALLGALALAPSGAHAQGLYYAGPVKVGVPSERQAGTNVDCPNGYLSVGGGYVMLGVGVEFALASYPENDSWFVQAYQPDDLRDGGFTASAACAPAETVPGYQRSSASVSLRDQDTGSAFAPCPAGTAAVGGGWATPKGPEVSDSNLDLLASAPTGDGWIITAKNEQLDYSDTPLSGRALAICIPAQIANGIFHVYYWSNGATFGDNQLIAPCAAGGLAFGGAGRSSGTGTFSTMNFEDDTQWLIYWRADHVGSDAVVSTAICGDVPPLLGPLTQADWNNACEQLFPAPPPVRAVPGAQAPDWTCVLDGFKPIPLPARDACFLTYKKSDPAATYTNINDPLSWLCYDESRSSASPGSSASSRSARASATRTRTLEGAARGHATGVGSKGRRGKVRIAGKARLPSHINLAKSRVVIRNVALEGSSRGELFKRGKRKRKRKLFQSPEALPIRLSGRGSRDAAVFHNSAGPRFTLRLEQDRVRNVLRFRLLARKISVRKPLLCSAPPRPITDLKTRFLIEQRNGRRTEVVVRRYWRCGAHSLTTAKSALPSP